MLAFRLHSIPEILREKSIGKLQDSQGVQNLSFRCGLTTRPADEPVLKWFQQRLRNGYRSELYFLNLSHNRRLRYCQSHFKSVYLSYWERIDDGEHQPKPGFFDVAVADPESMTLSPSVIGSPNWAARSLSTDIALFATWVSSSVNNLCSKERGEEVEISPLESRTRKNYETLGEKISYIPLQGDSCRGGPEFTSWDIGVIFATVACPPACRGLYRALISIRTGFVEKAATSYGPDKISRKSFSNSDIVRQKIRRKVVLCLLVERWLRETEIGYSLNMLSKHLLDDPG